MPEPRDPRPHALFEHAHEHVRRYELAAFAELFAPDGTMEFPFAPPGAPRRLDGRDAIREVLVAAAAAGRRERRITGYRDIVVHETTDPEVIVVEFTLEGEIVATGRTYSVPYIQVLRARDGQIVSLRDYIDYAALAAVTGGLPRALSGADA